VGNPPLKLRRNEVNLTRTRAARILMIGATLGMTIGLASSGLTAAAAADQEPPTVEPVGNTEPADTEPVLTPPAPEPPATPAPPATEPVAETTPPATDAAAEPTTPTTQPETENTPPATQPDADNAPTASTEPPTPPSSVAASAPSTPSSSAPAATVVSEPSPASIITTTYITKPTAPRSLAAAATNVSGQIRLYWAAPASNGGWPITDYIIQRSPNGWSSWATINDGVRNTTGYTVTGLANGTRYYFRVYARNAVGQSPASNIVSAVPRAKPTAPRSLAAAPTNLSGQIRLTWVVPLTNSGSAITDYIIQRSPNGSSSWVTINDGVRNTTGYTVGGLANGTRYYFRVYARNAVGQSPASNIVSAIPRSVVTVPGVVSYFDVFAYYDGYDLYWGDPASTGGSPITGFVVQALDYVTNSWFTVGTADSSWRDAFVPVEPGEGCDTFRIAAKNAVGVGPYRVAAEACYWVDAAQVAAAHVEGPTGRVAGAGVLETA
jgi:hypothetical protein